MSYQGFGYSPPYQYLPTGQNAQPPSYSSLRRIPESSALATPSIQQTPDRNYGQQRYEWQSRNAADISSQNAQRQSQTGTWQPTNNTSHSYNHQCRQQSSYQGSNAMPSISSSISSQQAQQSQQPQQPQHSQEGHYQVLTPSFKNTQYGSSGWDPLAMPKSAADSQAQNGSSTKVALTVDRPNPTQHSRSASASAMTSNIPTSRAASQRLSTDQTGSPLTSHSYLNCGTPLSNSSSLNTATGHSSSAHVDQPYRQQNAKQQYSRMSTATAQSNMSKNQQPVTQTHHTYSPTMSVAPTPTLMYWDHSTSPKQQHVTGHNNTDIAPRQTPTMSHTQNDMSNPYYISSTSKDQSVHTSQSQSYQPPPSNFIDPSQIYNPYYQEYQKKKAAEAEAGTEHMKQKEIENQKKIERQKESQEQTPRTELRQKVAATGRFAARVRAKRKQDENLSAANSARSEKAIPVRKPRPKPKVQAPIPADSPQGQCQNTPEMQQCGQGISQVKPLGSVTPAETAETAPQSPPASTALPTRDNSHKAAAAAQTPAEKQSNEDEELEMKLMFEKIKKLKAKDPSKFSELLDGLDMPDPTAPLPQDVEDQKQAKAPISIPAASATVNLADDANSLIDRGKFPAARRKRKSKAVDVVNHVAHSSSISVNAQQPVPGASLPPETNKNDQPTSMGETTKVDKLINSTKVKPAPLSAPTLAVVRLTQPAPEQAKEATTKSGTIWPEPKRLALAEAASTYINVITTNISKGKICTPEMVLSLIDQNPSYIELCGMLESQGYSLNRVHFAKHLLKAVPDLTNNSNPSTRPNPPAKGPAIGERNSPVIRPALTQSQTQTTPPPSATQILPPIQYENASAGAVSRHASDPIPPVTATTEEPRTQALENREGKPSIPPSSMLPPPNGSPGYFQRYQLPVSAPPENQVPGFLESHPPPPTFPNGKQTPRPAGPHSQPKKPAAFQNSISVPVPNPIGAKLKLKFRVPAPPAHAPLPGSKEALAIKRTFAEIADLTELSTDDEDSPPLPKATCLQDLRPPCNTNMDMDVQEVLAPAVETHMDPAASAKTLDLSHFIMTEADSSTNNNEELRRRTDIVKPLNKTEALKTRYYDPKTIARDILIATGRHPTERPLNQHLSKLRDNFPAVENSSDLQTFRWDIVDPGGPPPPEIPLVSAVSKPPFITVRQYAKPPDRLSNHISRDLPLADTSAHSNPTQFAHVPSQLRISQTLNNNGDLPLHGEHEHNKTEDIDNSAMSSTRPMSRPRRRGRPPGAKNKLKFADQVEVAIPTTSAPKASKIPYSTFKCEWKGCDAQLHNLQTLRKHVSRLHIPSGNVTGASCLWVGCNGSGSSPTSDNLTDHMEKTHLSALAWTLGEGPGSVRSDHPDYSIDDYLNDSNGRTVIARATTEGTRPTLILPAAYRSIRSFNKMYGNESDKAKALEVMRALEMKQVRVGTGLGRGGCTFMNEKRQETVASFERVFEIVPEVNDGL
ncbi:hypothetical protein AJ78_08205 [Emergomyces pasteurianus Ep9510]|uniref:C2H2-type domain-containing protein n=1 Tax=Emergomyces pasteurianus Ep9510 TaxID=1447872 RepID=A0A1J9Q6X3_9EURO|nr:hypothetical protein AJ78_08205 [Emergomyces pasteurianus Ep9510]